MRRTALDGVGEVEQMVGGCFSEGDPTHVSLMWTLIGLAYETLSLVLRCGSICLTFFHKFKLESGLGLTWTLEHVRTPTQATHGGVEEQRTKQQKELRPS